MPGGDGYATGSVEGRIAVEYLGEDKDAQDRKYAFKCHRAAVEDVDHVWPVNALAFHPMYVRPVLLYTRIHAHHGLVLF